MIAPQLELRLGSPVIARDGQVGYVTHIFLHLQQRCIVAMVLQRSGLFSRPVIVPLTQVTSATDREVHLRISCSQTGVLPRLYPRRYSRTGQCQGFGLGNTQTPSHSQIQRSAQNIDINRDARRSYQGPLSEYVLIHARQKVFCQNGYAGRIVGFLLAPDGRVLHMLLRYTSPLPRIVRVPIDHLHQIERRGLHLTIDRCDLKKLSLYHANRDIEARISTAFRSDNRLSMLDCRTIQVMVHEGRVQLSGYVSTAVSKLYAERVALGVSGVCVVENQLVSDDELVYGVSQALAHNRGTRGQRIFVYVRQGVVYLSGSVKHAVVRETAQLCAARTARVRGVVNRIAVPGCTFDPEDQRILQPDIGKAVYSTDHLVGHVAQVVINPRDRRVSACVVDSLPTSNGSHSSSCRVIPMSFIRDVTPGGVLLSIDQQTVTRCPLFDRNSFMLPADDWQPPFPYQQSAILFEREYDPPDPIDLPIAHSHLQLALECGGSMIQTTRV